MSLECIWCPNWTPHMTIVNGFVQIASPNWTPHMTIVNGFVQIASIRAGHDLYAQAGGKPFSYCPFCGHELHEVAQPSPQIGDKL